MITTILSGFPLYYMIIQLITFIGIFVAFITDWNEKYFRLIFTFWFLFMGMIALMFGNTVMFTFVGVVYIVFCLVFFALYLTYKETANLRRKIV